MKVRNASNLSNAVSAIRMRNGANALIAVRSMRARDASSTLKSAFLAGGGGGGDISGTSVAISPPSRTISGSSNSVTGFFDANFSSPPSSISWSVVSGPGAITGGQGTARVSISVVDALGGGATVCTFKCTAVIGGATVTATATLSYTRT